MSLIVDIKKSLGTFRLDVSFQIERDTLALLGASGCGKSLTLKCIAGIDTPDEGYIELDGRVLFDSSKKINLTPQKRRVGYLFQQYALFPNMTVAQNIACGVREKSRRKDVVMDKISALQLADTLSVFGGTAIFVSHSRDEVYRLCDYVSVLNRGISEDKIPVKALFEDPKTLSSCLLSGCKNFSRIKQASGNHVEALDWGATLEVNREIPGDAEYLGVRSRSFIPSLEAGDNSLCCRVERVIDDVFTTVVMLSTPAGRMGYSLIRMELSKEKWADLGNPSELYLHIDPASIMLLRD